METQDNDMISVLPDDLLLGILECLDLREAVRAGAVSRRWRHLPHQLSWLDLDVKNFQGTTMLETMDAFTGALCTLLSACPLPPECKCDCGNRRAVNILGLCFHLSVPHLSSIGRTVENVVSRGETDRFVFELIPPFRDMTIPQKAELGKQFMSFSSAYPIAFRWLTAMSLERLEFGDSDLNSLIGACDNLNHLHLRYCRMAGDSVLKIDVPNSRITILGFVHFWCECIELISVPKLTRLSCYHWPYETPPLRFGYVPELQKLILDSQAKVWQTPFMLSECFSMNAKNLSELVLNFSSEMIWIQPEHPKQLTSIFSNLIDVALCCIYPECDLRWTLFILEAAPALQTFFLNRARHSCHEKSLANAKKTNMVWEPSNNLKHLNLKLLVMMGFEEEDKVTNYIRFVMERATRLKIIKLQSCICEECDAIDLECPRRSPADEASKHRIKERLTHGSSSSVEIIIC